MKTREDEEALERTILLSRREREDDEDSDDGPPTKSSNDDSPNDDKLWYNGNLFKCDKCQAVGNLDVTAFPHAGRCGDDKLQLKRTSDNMYDCKICSESIYHDYFAIGFHVRQQHKMNIHEYGTQHEHSNILDIKNEPNLTNE